ncbi:MAG: DUF4332 domain-containing protein [Candidatus Bathyarchaeia archaeon]
MIQWIIIAIFAVVLVGLLYYLNREKAKQELQEQTETEKPGETWEEDLIRESKPVKEKVEKIEEVEMQIEGGTILPEEEDHEIPEELIDLMGEGDAKKLTSAGINSLEEMFSRLGTESQIKELSDDSGIPYGELESVTILRALGSLDGVGPKYQELLRAAGVNNIYTLSMREAEELTTKLEEVNEEKGIVGRTPPSATVENWINQAIDMRSL